MFALSLRLLDGTCRPVEIEPDSTIAGLRAELTRELAIQPLQEIKLVQNLRELNDDDQIAVEVQAVIVPSLEKAVKVLEDAADFGNVPEQAVASAVALLDEVQDVPAALCDRLLNCLLRMGRLAVSHDVGAVFGRVCGDPEPYLESLIDLAGNYGIAHQFLSLAALAAIAVRCEESLRSHAKMIVGITVETLDLEEGATYMHARPEELATIRESCKLLGQLGTSDNIGFLKEVGSVITEDICSRTGRPSSNYDELLDATMAAANAAVKLIQAREISSLNLENRPNTINDNQVSAHPDADMSMDSKDETSEAASLVQALQESKQTIPSTGLPLNSDGVVLMRLTRMARSPQLREHLKTTPTLATCRRQVEDAGCSLEPSWGDGAQCFIPLAQEQVAEAELELSFDHVVILQSDIELLKSAIHEFNCKGKKRPTLAVAFPGRSQNLASVDRPTTASSSSSSVNPACEEDFVADGPVEVEPVGFLTLRTDSSYGFPEHPYQ